MLIDSARLMSGHPAADPDLDVQADALKGKYVQMAPGLTSFAGPWGVSYAANLTPDSTTGIGAWSEENFLNMFKTGKHMGMENGRPILPPMPWFNMMQAEEVDLKAMYAYLRSLKPVTNKVHAPVTPDQVKIKK